MVQADKGEGVLLRTLKGFMANNGLSTEARMAQVAEGELPPDELKNDLKLQLARLVSTGADSSQVEAAKELIQSVSGHQLLNVQTQNSGFFIIPLVVAYHQRIDEWRMTVVEEEAEGERWFRLTLLSSPPGIGTIRIDLSYAERSKHLDMLFWVEREDSKRLLDQALPLLKEEFVESKVNLTRVEVGISKHLSKDDLPIEIGRPCLLQTKA
jgi:flagellar hook-length control protein FliK